MTAIRNMRDFLLHLAVIARKAMHALFPDNTPVGRAEIELKNAAEADPRIKLSPHTLSFVLVTLRRYLFREGNNRASSFRFEWLECCKDLENMVTAKKQLNDNRVNCHCSFRGIQIEWPRNDEDFLPLQFCKRGCLVDLAPPPAASDADGAGPSAAQPSSDVVHFSATAPPDSAVVDPSAATGAATGYHAD